LFIQKPSEYFIDYTFPFKTAVTLPPKFTFRTGFPRSLSDKLIAPLQKRPQRFIVVCVIVYLLLILTYKFTKIKGFSKKFLKLSKAAF